MTRRFPSVHPVLLVAVSVGVLWVVAVIRFRGWIATDDHAILQLGLERIGDGRIPLTGAYSRLGIRHPGPLREWWFGAAYWLSGRRAGALPATALALNVTSGIVALAAARASGGARHVIGAAAGLLLLVIGLRLDLHSPWNPHLAVLAGWAALWTTVAALRRSGWVRPAAVVYLSFTAQLHAAFLPLAGVALVAVLVAWWRDMPARRRWQPGALLVALWLGPLLDLRHGRQANLVRIVLDSDGDRIGPVGAVRYVAHLILPWSLGRGDFRTPGATPPPTLPAWLAIALLAALATALLLLTRVVGADADTSSDDTPVIGPQPLTAGRAEVTAGDRGHPPGGYVASVGEPGAEGAAGADRGSAGVAFGRGSRPGGDLAGGRRPRAAGADRVLAGVVLGGVGLAVVSGALFVEPIYPYLLAPLAGTLAGPVGVAATVVGGVLPRRRLVAAVLAGAAALAAVPALVGVESAVDSPVERGLRGALAGRVQPGTGYDIRAAGMEVVTYAQVALLVEQLGGHPYSAIDSLGLDPAPPSADMLVTAMGDPLACLQANTSPEALVALDVNTFTGRLVSVFLLPPGTPPPC